MKWIIGGAVLLLVLHSRQAGMAAGASSPVLTNQSNSGSPLNVAQNLAKQIGTVLVDITGAPTTPANNSASVANPASNPNWSGIGYSGAAPQFPM